MTKKSFSTEMIIGLMAMVISLSTLIVFVYQTNLIRKQQHMSAYPHLSIGHMSSVSEDYRFALTNKGVGPAFITSVDVKDADGKSYDTLLDYVRDNISDKDSINLNYSDIMEGFLIAEKESIDLFKLSDRFEESNTIHAANALREMLIANNLKLSISYKSIYGDSWTIRNGATIPAKN